MQKKEGVGARKIRIKDKEKSYIELTIYIIFEYKYVNKRHNLQFNIIMPNSQNKKKVNNIFLGLYSEIISTKIQAIPARFGRSNKRC